MKALRGLFDRLRGVKEPETQKAETRRTDRSIFATSEAAPERDSVSSDARVSAKSAPKNLVEQMMDPKTKNRDVNVVTGIDDYLYSVRGNTDAPTQATEVFTAILEKNGVNVSKDKDVVEGFITTTGNALNVGKIYALKDGESSVGDDGVSITGVSNNIRDAANADAVSRIADPVKKNQLRGALEDFNNIQIGFMDGKITNRDQALAALGVVSPAATLVRDSKNSSPEGESVGSADTDPLSARSSATNSVESLVSTPLATAQVTSAARFEPHPPEGKSPRATARITPEIAEQANDAAVGFLGAIKGGGAKDAGSSEMDISVFNDPSRSSGGAVNKEPNKGGGAKASGDDHGMDEFAREHAARAKAAGNRGVPKPNDPAGGLSR